MHSSTAEKSIVPMVSSMILFRVSADAIVSSKSRCAYSLLMRKRIPCIYPTENGISLKDGGSTKRESTMHTTKPYTDAIAYYTSI